MGVAARKTRLQGEKTKFTREKNETIEMLIKKTSPEADKKNVEKQNFVRNFKTNGGLASFGEKQLQIEKEIRKDK